MIRLTASVLLAAGWLAACSAKDEAPAEPAVVDVASVAEPAAAPAEPDGFELSYKLESANYTVTSEIDPAILAFDPALAYRLWTQAKSSHDALGVQAADDKRSADAMSAETGEASWFMGYSLDIIDKAHAVLGDFISVEETVSTFTGGAHPNYFLGGETWRKGDLEPLPLSTFVKDEAAFTELVVKNIVDQKAERGIEPYLGRSHEASIRDLLLPTTEVPDVYAGKVVLEPSTVAGKAGGITVLFSPYEVGSYAEGAYTVTLPAADLAPILTPDWASRFGGDLIVRQDAPVTEE
jgi:Protein of unknown function (DUF3298)